MPDATITSTASTFGTISGTFAADQSTVTGTISGTVTGTLTGSVGVPGPAGPGVPAGGTAGQYLQKIDGVDYNTDWVTINLSAYAPLNSPVFTGDPQAPTPTFGDNDTSIATTAFVQAGLLGGTANAKNLEVYVRNQSGSTIPAGSIVYISGATGNRPLITLAQANNDANSAQTMGFTKTSIANNGFGYVIVRGELENIDTSALTEGVQLYLSPTTAGTWTTTKPSAPQHLVYVGIVVRAHPTLGVILVAVQNGYELNELHDVAITSPTNGQVLKYNSSTNLWVNGTDSSGVAWGAITGTLSAQTDLQTALDGKYSTSNPSGYITSSALTGYATESWVTAGFYPLTGNPSGFITSSALTPYAPLAGATFTGEVITPSSTTSNAGLTITPGVAPTTPTNGEIWATTNDLQVRLNGVTETIAEQSWVTSQGYITSSALTPYAPLAGATFTGLVGTVASTTTTAGLNLPHGTAPTSPVNGDIWTTTSGLFARINAGTQQYAPLGSNNTFSNASSTYGSSTAAGTINLASGATVSGSTKNVNIGTSGVSGSTTLITVGPVAGASTTTIGATTASSTLNLATGATLSGSTKTINIGTSGVLGSTNVINIGPTATSGTINFNNNSVSLGSNSTASTAAADTNTTALATTAFVVGQAGSAIPLVNGTAAVGTSLRYARQDHVHPTDTSRAALASPTFTGTPAAPTAAVDTNTTQIATTAYVVGQGYLKSATASSTYAPLASPALTGTPTAPTATAGTNTTQIATTAFVLANAGSTTYATDAQVITGTSTTTSLYPGHAGFLKADPRLRQLGPANSTSVSGSGAVTANSGLLYAREMYLGSLASGRAAFSYGILGVTAGIITSKADRNKIDFSKKVWVAGSCSPGIISSGTSYVGDSNTIARISLGGYTGYTTGNMTQKGIGWKKVGGTSSVIQLTVHNGTTLTDVSTSVTVAADASIDWIIYSDGTGNVTLYINGTQAATTSAGPTGTTTTAYNHYYEQVEAVSTPGVRHAMHANGGWIYFAD